VSWKPSKRLAFWSVLGALVFPAACGSSGIVGGECAASYVDCDGRCVDAQNDPDNCGGCARACDPGVACHNGVCSGTLDDGSAGNSNGGGSAEAGASGDPGASGNGGSSGTGVNGGEAGDDLDAGELSDAKHDGDAACAPPYKRPEACGNCATKCSKAAPTCSPDGMGSYVCVLVCDDPLKVCDGQCVDYNIDSENCGSCGNSCPSGICQGGKCAGANVGHVVLACMDYQTPAKNTAQTALMGNAVLLPIRNPVRILAYTEYAPAAERAKVDQDVGFAAAARGRTFSITPLTKYTSATASLNISNYDVFLIYDQTGAPAGQLANVGSAWQKNSVVDSFASAGGVVIALSGGKSEMDQFLSSSELLDVSAQTVVSASTLYNRAPADAMGINVISPFFAPMNSCTFTTSVVQDADNIFVVRDAASPAAGSPVVVHRVIEP
jgi:Stigma-specific protein, Stig1